MGSKAHVPRAAETATSILGPSPTTICAQYSTEAGAKQNCTVDHAATCEIDWSMETRGNQKRQWVVGESLAFHIQS